MQTNIYIQSIVCLELQPGGLLQWTMGGNVSDSFTNWAKTEPNLNKNQADCVRLNTDSKNAEWSVADDCLETNAFMCEIPLHKLPQEVVTTGN